MIINYKRIYGRNFNSLGEFELYISPGKHLVLGKNGEGKSSLFDSIPYTQYGEYRRGNDPSRDGKGDCMTGIEFEAGDHSYKVERYFKDKISGNGNKSLIYVDGNDISDRLSSDTDELIKQTIGIPPDLFMSACVVAQGIPVNFSKMTPTIRKLMIEHVLGYSVCDKIRSKFNKELSNAEIKESQLNLPLESKRSNLISLNSRLEALNFSNKASRTQLEQKILTLKSEYRDLGDKIKPINEDLEKLLNGKSLASLSNDQRILSSSTHNVSSKIANLNQVLKTGICSMCERPYPEERISRDTDELKFLTEKEKKLLKSEKDLNNTIKTITDLKSNQSRLDVSLRMKMSEIKRSNDELKELSSSKDDNDDILQLKSEIDELVNNINSVENEVSIVRQDIEYLSYIDKLLLPSSPMRTEMLQSHIEAISNIINKVAKLVFDQLTINLVVDKRNTGIDIEVYKGKKKCNLKSLSGGESRRFDLILVFALQRFLIEASGIRTNLVVLDEIMDALDKDGISTVMQCLDILFPENMSVYIITHNDSVKTGFDSIIRLVKINEVSRVMV